MHIRLLFRLKHDTRLSKRRTMNTYLHALSSLPVLYEAGGNLKATRRQQLQFCSPNIQEYSKEERCLHRMGLYTLPIHTFASCKAERVRTNRITTHVWGISVPKGSFLELMEGLYLSSPEFCFLQMASHLDLIDLIRFGYELCGNYRIDSDSPYGFASVTPLTSKKKLTDYLQRSNGIPGTVKATRAARLIRDSSNSPRETALSMMLGLPTRLGGWQFGDHLLNHPLETDEGGWTTTRRYIDIYWPDSGFGIEYDSDYFHADSKRLANDSFREKTIALQGVRLMRLTNRELNSSRTRDLAFKLIAAELGIRLRNTSLDVLNRRRSLALRLLKPHDALWV